MKESLEARFARFLASLQGTEVIDEMDWPVDPQRRRKADFLLAERKVILELKTLTEVDLPTKVDARVDKHRERDEFPLFYGKADLRKVLSRLPDGDAAYRGVVNAIGRSTEDAVRLAEEQVAHTRHVLGLPDAVGLLVVLNDSVDILDPNVVGHRVVQLLKRSRTGRSDAEKVDFVWLHFESHSVGDIGGVPAVVSALIRGEGAARFQWFPAFHKDLVSRWAAANGGVSVDGGGLDPASLTYRPMSEVTSPQLASVPRHEVWRRQYRSRPYLREMSDDAVLAHGDALMQRLTPHFVTGGLGFVEERDAPLIEQWTHFLEEATWRALDLRRMRKP